ncbi:MAG: prephenate dehydrogenase/arogenate dehydrogenase family protein, partial [candidate division NC10 bacterium]|nr:prephenate dehydrogenase/arogenate dehydrogenase family protein [candidate division NC10 bacterium]
MGREERMMIGFLGPPGSDSERVARQQSPEAALVAYPSIDAVFEALAKKAVERGVVPLESQMEGPVTETLDNLFEYAGVAKIADAIIVPVLGEGRQDKVKYAVLGADYHGRTGKDATSLVIYPHRDRIGLLEDMLHIISREYGLNLSSIHSRPDTKGGFRFYIELEGHLEDQAVSHCILDLESKLAADEAEVRVFGAYPRCLFIEPRIQGIGIIGGTGQMGGWFSRFFRGARYRVLISGRRTPLTYPECVEQSDAVVINVPIPYAVQVIETVGRYFRAGQLIVDNTSIKTQPVEAMLRSVPEGVEVLGMHTVFGPSIKELRNQNVVFTYTPKSGELCQEFEGIFYKFGARITRTTPEFHDQQMAFHQNLEHFTKIALAEVLRERFGGPQGLAAYSSPNSRMSLITMGRILNLDPRMASEIQSFNLQGRGMIEEYLKVVTRLGRAMREGDVEALRNSMEESVQRFGPEFLAQMLRASQEIEDHLGKWERTSRKREH